MRIPLCDRLPSTDPNHNCTIVLCARSNVSRVRQRIRHHVRLVIFQIHNSFTFLYSYHYWHWRFSLEFWMNSNWIISRRDWFWKRTFSKMGFTWNNKYEVQVLHTFEIFPFVCLYTVIYSYTGMYIWNENLNIRYESVCLSFTGSRWIRIRVLRKWKLLVANCYCIDLSWY